MILFVSNPVNAGCKTSVVHKGDIIELPAPSPEVLDLEDEGFEDLEISDFWTSGFWDFRI